MKQKRLFHISIYYFCFCMLFLAILYIGLRTENNFALKILGGAVVTLSIIGLVLFIVVLGTRKKPASPYFGYALLLNFLSAALPHIFLFALISQLH